MEAAGWEALEMLGARRVEALLAREMAGRTAAVPMEVAPWAAPKGEEAKAAPAPVEAKEVVGRAVDAREGLWAGHMEGCSAVGVTVAVAWVGRAVRVAAVAARVAPGVAVPSAARVVAQAVAAAADAAAVLGQW